MGRLTRRLMVAESAQARRRACRCPADGSKLPAREPRRCPRDCTDRPEWGLGTIPCPGSHNGWTNRATPPPGGSCEHHRCRRHRPRLRRAARSGGVKTTDDLLERGATEKGREELEAATGIGHALILKWVNRVDLYRIKGVGSEYSDLLEIAGVDTVPELAQRNAANLTETLAEANAARNLVRQAAHPGEVTDWIEQAKQLPRVVQY
jgi:predicted flap endonuclease-1-like 5' DNA nuclease